MDETQDEVVPFLAINLVADGPTSWQKETRKFAKTREKWTRMWCLANFVLILIGALIAVSIGLLFPRNLNLSILQASISSPQNHSDGTYTAFLNSWQQISNSLAGPIQFGNMTYRNLQLRLPPLQSIVYNVTIDLSVDPSKVLSDFNNTAYYHAAEIFLLKFISNLFDGETLFVASGSVEFKILSIDMNLTDTIYETVTTSFGPSNQTGYSHQPFFFDTEPLDYPYDDPPTPPNPENPPLIPRWFIVNYGTFLFIIISIGLLLMCSDLIEKRYYFEIEKAQEKKIRAQTGQHRKSSNSLRQGLKQGYEIYFDNLGLTVGKNQVIEGVSGSFLPGRLTAIMGPSGCGKTSMLSALSGRATYGITTGNIFVNGEKTSISKWKKVVGFVPQEDVMLRMLTVEEILFHSARTRLPSSNDWETHAIIVEEVIELLGLEHIRNSVIGDENTRGVSGGQRKRVNIAMELVANPDILFLDEPTSGLDSAASIEVCQVLHRLAQTGLTIVAVIHQPRYEIFDMFDDIALLGIGGRPVYLGPTSELAFYFSKFNYICPPRLNPADFFLDIIVGNYDDEMPFLEDPQEIEHFQALELDRVTTCKKLQYRWSEHTQKLRTEGKERRPAVSQDKFDVLGSDSDLGTIWDATMMFTLCLIFPFGLLLFHIPDFPARRSIHGQFGAVIGALCALNTYFSLILMLVDSYLIWTVVTIESILASILALIIPLYIARIYQKITIDPTFFRVFFLGLITGPFCILISFVFYKRNRQLSSGLFAGAMLFSVLAMLPVPGVFHTFNHFLIITTITSVIGLLAIAKLCTWTYRYFNVLSEERKTIGFWYLTVLYARRDFLVQMRNWKGVVFHITQISFGALFLGFIFYARGYQGPLFQGRSNSTSDESTLCSARFFEDPIMKPVCYFLQIPVDDPLGAIATLNSFTMALCAVSYAVPIFGSERSVFLRETSTGSSTGAYYLGKSIAQLPIALFAPVVYLLAFAGLGVLKAPWAIHYTLLLTTYAFFTGVGYVISLVTPNSVSQLAAIFIVLITMMFSGSNPTLLQLQQNALLGKVLWYPTFVSFTRWANELFYIHEVMRYTSHFGTMALLFDYHIEDITLSWCSMSFGIAFFRILGYVLLVLTEHK